MPLTRFLGASILTVVTFGWPFQLASAQELVTGPPASAPEAGLNVPLWTPQRAPVAGDAVAFSSTPDKFGSARIQLSNGNLSVDPAEWRAVAFSDERNGEFCTLTLVGPRVVLSAAHCVDAGRAPGSAGPHTVPATVRFGGQVYTMRCDIPEDYRRYPVNPMGAPRSTEDFALCELDRDVAGVDAEAISTSVILSPPDSRVRLMGYGCTNLGLSPSFRYTYVRGDQSLRMGDQTIDASRISIYPSRPGIYVRTLSDSSAEPVICFGDSGGPVMVSSADGRGRVVVAVNSAVGATPAATPQSPAFYSYLSPLGTPAFRSFLADWVSRPAAGPNEPRPRIICGHNRAPGLGGCRP